VQLDLGAERVRLLPGRAVAWGKTVLVADVHFGKSDTFRHYGLPLPDADLDVDLDRLTQLVTHAAADRLLVLGDLVHAQVGLNDDVVRRVADWRAALDAEVELVPGNHDRHAPPDAWRIALRPEGHREGGFRFVHQPSTDSAAYTWCGHVHPAVVVGRGRHADRFPCFWLGAALGMLPAFGTFTGGHGVRPVPGDRVVAVTSEGLIDIPVPPGAGR